MNIKKIYVAGHNGMVGSALVRNLRDKGNYNIITRNKNELNLIDQKKVYNFLSEEKPDFIFLAAAKVGGIEANKNFPASFIYENLIIQNNIIQSAYLAGVEKICFLGSSCVYPRDCQQPIKEEYLLTGPLEETNKSYAIAKITGIEMCNAYNKQYGTSYFSVMPTNLYGPNDNYDLNSSHVIPALIRKVHEAKQRGDKELIVWGTGNPRREVLHVDDSAEACVFLMEKGITQGVYNIGTGQDLTITELTKLLMEVMDYKGDIKYDKTKPDGTPRKQLDVSKIQDLGWKAKIELKEGLAMAYEDYLCNS
jgi:GDP-L-fucose synthase